MDLKEFVKRALIGIHEGVSEASTEIGDNIVNPPLLLSRRAEAWPDRLIPCAEHAGGRASGEFAQMVEFEIGVTVETSGAAEAGAQVEILKVVKLGQISGEASRTKENVNQIRFLVPMRVSLSGNKSSS